MLSEDPIITKVRKAASGRRLSKGMRTRNVQTMIAVISMRGTLDAVTDTCTSTTLANYNHSDSYSNNYKDHLLYV